MHLDQNNLNTLCFIINMLIYNYMSAYVQIWGKHAVFAALKNPDRVILQIQCIENVKEEILSINSNAKIDVVSRAYLNKKFPNIQHQGVILTCSSLPCCNKLSSCSHIQPEDKIIVLDQIQDPHNIGAILRSMAAFGFKHLIITKDNAPSLDGIIAKNACGGLEHVHIIKVTNLADSLIYLKKKKGFWCFGLEENGDICSNHLLGGFALIIGSEGKGIRHRVKSECDGFIKIETNPSFPVLNASVAAALGMYILRGKK